MVSEELFANALGISDPRYVKRVNFKGADRLLMVEIDFRPGSRFAVDGVEGEHPARDTETKFYQHLKFFQYARELEVRVPRVRLPDGTLSLIKLPWAGKLDGLTLFQRGSKRLHKCGRLFRGSSIQHAFDRGPGRDYSIPPAPPVRCR